MAAVNTYVNNLKGNDLIKLIIQNIKNDLSSRNPVHVNLALHCIANVGTPEMAEAFFSEIPKLLISKEDIDSVKQRLALDFKSKIVIDYFIVRHYVCFDYIVLHHNISPLENGKVE